MSLRHLLLRLIRSERASVATLAALVAVTAFLAAAAPLALLRMADDGLRTAIRQVPQPARDITVSVDRAEPLPGNVVNPAGLGTDPRALELVRTQLLNRLGPTLRQAVVDSSYSARLWPAPTDPVRRAASGHDVAFSLRVQSDYLRRVRFVAGGPPAVRPGPGFDVAVSARSAEVAGLRVGQTATLSSPRWTASVPVRIAGVYEPLDPGSAFWSADTSMAAPAPWLDPDSGPLDPVVYEVVSLLVAPESLPGVLAVEPTVYTAPRESGVAWRFELDPDRLHGGQAAALRRELTGYVSSATVDIDVTVATGLLNALDRYRELLAAAHTVISLALSGLLLIGLAVLALAARLGVQRRHATLELFRARGGSVPQLCGLLAAEAALVAVPAAAAGLLTAVVLLPGRGVMASARLAAVVAVALIVLVPYLAARGSRRPGGVTRVDVVRHRPSLRRLTAEVLILVVAALAVMQLRRRGLPAAANSDAAGGGDSSVDPLLVSVPILVGLAVAVLAMRCYPAPVRLLGQVAARSRRAVPFLGLARAGRESPATVLPLVVVLMAVFLGVFADTIRATVRTGQDEVAWRQVGADARIEGSGGLRLPASTVRRLPGVPGIDAVAPGLVETVRVRTRSGLADVRVVAVDVPAYAAVLDRSPTSFRFPAELSAPVSRGGAVPALVTAPLAARLAGDGVDAHIGNSAVRLRRVGDPAGLPGADANNVVVVPLAALRAATGAAYEPNVVWLRGGGARRDAVRAALADVDPAPFVTVRSELHDKVRSAPLVDGALVAFVVAILIAAGYCVFALRLALQVSTRPRERMLAALRTVGLSPRQATLLSVLEFMPVVLLAAVVGMSAGVALPYLLGPVLGLGRFTGSGAEPALQVDAVTATAATGALVGFVLLALGVQSAVMVRRGLAADLRLAEEE